MRRSHRVERRLFSQRSDRIGPRRAPGRQEARCQRGDRHHHEGRPESQRVAWGHLVEEASDQPCQAKRRRRAQEEASGRQLRPCDITSRNRSDAPAEGYPQAQLAPALGNRVRHHPYSPTAASNSANPPNSSVLVREELGIARGLQRELPLSCLSSRPTGFGRADQDRVRTDMCLTSQDSKAVISNSCGCPRGSIGGRDCVLLTP